MDRLRNARCLFCQHTFCFDCLESCVQSGREAASVITCPVCRVVTRLPREGVAGLKGNALINSVLGKLEEWDKTTNHGPNSKGDSKGQGSKPCESCKKPRMNAKYFCHHCKKHLCLECVQGRKHDSHKKTVSGPDADQNCQEHCWVPVKFYCFQCDKLCCHLCNHGANTTITLQKKASTVRSLMQGLVDQCSNKSFGIQTTHHKVNIMREDAVDLLQKLMVEIRQKAAKVISKVKGKEEELMHYLQMVMREVEEEMEEKQNKCSNLEDGLQAAVTEWQTLQESSSDAEMVRKQGSIEKKMNDLLKASDVTPSSALSKALKNPGLQFIPGKLYLEASCSGSELGELDVRPYWKTSHNVAPFDSVSQLIYMNDGTLLIADTWNGISVVSPLPSAKTTTLVDGKIVRDLTVLAGSTIVYQNNEKEIFKIVDKSSSILHGFGGKWVSVTCCPSEGQDLIVVADQNFHDQNIVFMDTEGNMVNTLATSFISGVRHLRFDKSQNAIFIDHDRRGVRCRRLRSDGVQKFLIAEENTLYLAVACHQSNFLYVASQKASAPNVVNIKKHSLEDGGLLETLRANLQVQNAFRMVMANWKDKGLAYVEGSQVVIVVAATNANASTVLQL